MGSARDPREPGRRSVGIDALKGLAIFAVVGLHTLPIYSHRLTGPGAFGINLLALAVPVFMVASIRFAASEVPRIGWNSIRRRASRLTAIYFFWTAFYLAWLSALRPGYWASVTTGRWTTFQTIFLGGAFFHLYFLPALIQLLLALPILVLATRRRGWAWAAFAVTTAALVFGDFARPGSLAVAWLHHRWIFDWLPEGIAAAGLAAGTIRCRRPILWIAAGVALLLVESQIALHHNNPSVTAYARAGLPIASVGLFVLAQQLRSVPRWLGRLGQHSLGVYLLHIVTLHYLLTVYTNVHLSLLGQSGVVLVTVAGSWLATELIELTPAKVAFGRRLTRMRRDDYEPRSAVPAYISGRGLRSHSY